VKLHVLQIVMMCYIEFWIMYMYYRVGYFSGTFVYLDYVHTLLFIFASIVILKYFPKFASNYVLGHFLELPLIVF
jgi:hypothetical protein